MKKILIITALALATACGAPSDDDVSGAIADSLVGDSSLTSIGLEIGPEEGECVGDAWAGDIGADKLEEYGLITTDGSTPAGGLPSMDEADARKAAEAFTTCIDVKAGLASTFESQAKVTAQQADCMVAKLADGDVEELFATIFAGGTPDMSSMFSGASDCLV